MRARAWLILPWLVSTAAAEPKPETIDIKPFKDQLMVFQDSAGGTYAVLRTKDDKRIFYGTGKTLYEQMVTGGSANGDAWAINAFAPRIGEFHPAQIQRMDDGTFMRTCWGKDDVVLTQLTGDKAAAVLDKYAFKAPYLVRAPYLLARDETGVYYFVDRLRDRYGGKGYKIWVGKKGSLKEKPLTDVTTDEAGEVFATKTGELRFVRTIEEDKKADTAWVRGGKRTKLINLSLEMNEQLVYKELGVYTVLGTLCDNI